MKSTFQKLPLFLSVIFFVLLSAVFVFGYKTIMNNNQKADLDMLTWATEAARRNEIISLNHSVQTIAANKSLIENHFAASTNVVPLLDTVERLATEAGAEAEVDSVNTGTNKKSLFVGVKASGSFQSIYKFLTLLENSPYELDFTSMDLQSSSDPKNPQWDAVFTVQLLTYEP